MVSWYAAQRLASIRDDAYVGRPMRATARLELLAVFLAVIYAACREVAQNLVT